MKVVPKIADILKLVAMRSMRRKPGELGETVSYVQQGIMRKDDALEHLKFEKINNQIAFCSSRSFDFLKYTDHLIVEEFS